MLEVAEGIQYLHSEGIIHGDLHGVSLLLSYFSNQLIRPSAREMSSWIVISTAKSPILDRLDMLKLLLLNPLRQFPYISLRLNCSACAPGVACLSAMVAMRATERSIQVKRRKLTFMHSAAFIMQCVSGFPYHTRRIER
jgi:serine/threonine protein kinase